jgi:hypothetical protein
VSRNAQHLRVPDQAEIACIIQIPIPWKVIALVDRPRPHIYALFKDSSDQDQPDEDKKRLPKKIIRSS